MTTPRTETTLNIAGEMLYGLASESTPIRLAAMHNLRLQRPFLPEAVSSLYPGHYVVGIAETFTRGIGWVAVKETFSRENLETLRLRGVERVNLQVRCRGDKFPDFTIAELLRS